MDTPTCGLCHGMGTITEYEDTWACPACSEGGKYNVKDVYNVDTEEKAKEKLEGN